MQKDGPAPAPIAVPASVQPQRMSMPQDAMDSFFHEVRSVIASGSQADRVN